ncbi:MAG: proline racemase family protein, partial [Calditrichaeota bacterium]|nr:proline racemase family protein [Calditrichota bacterium]
DLECLDMHTGGEPLRIILSGYPKLKGSTILEKRRDAKENYDHLRQSLIFEPRGHADMYGCILTDACSADADFGVLFIHNEGYSTMCGHAIIAIATALFKSGAIGKNEIRIESPAGIIHAYGRFNEKRELLSVYFHNVPSFVDELDAKINVPGLGTIHYDLAFGGAYYAFVDAERLDLSLMPDNQRQLIDTAMRIKRQIMAERKIVHPLESDLSFLYGVIFTGKAHSAENHSRNVCIFANGEVDRSPTGTGVSARAAIHFARNEIELGQAIQIESIVDSVFSVSAIEECDFHGKAAIIPQVEGQAHISGRSRFIIDPQDPLKNGFLIR